MRVFSEDFGRYVWHKVIVADARDGMEYPMITLDSGTDPGYRDLLAHEIGHMWFFGQVGNNETYRALLDEGFTEFLTAWAMIEIDGENDGHKCGMRNAGLDRDLIEKCEMWNGVFDKNVRNC